LVDSVGNRLSTSAGVTVSLDGANYTTQTDSAGFWEIGNVSPGNYNVTVSKTGFGLIRAYGVTIEGPGMAYVSPQMTLGIAPSTVPVLSNVVIAPRKDSGVVTNDSLLSGDYSGGANMFFIDNSPNVQPGDAHMLLEYGTEGGNHFDYSLSNLRSAGIKSGMTVYLSACELNWSSVWIYGGGYSSGTYYDPVDNSTRFISPGPRSNVVAITIP
jgi:hypothetical protein